MAKKLKVCIEATQTVHYRRTVEMTQDEYDELVELFELADEGRVLDIDECWLRPEDVHFGESVENIELEIVQ